MMTIAKLATKAKVAPHTVRFYDRKGLLHPAGRTSSGYRIYPEEAVGRLEFIRKAQRSGLRLREIAELLEIRDRGLCPCGRTAEVLQARIDEAEQEIGRLRDLQADLKAMIKSVESKQEWCYQPEQSNDKRRVQKNGKKTG
ncbi:MAG: MerR family transcriptional regulator [Actinomycetota bacterium]